ncbi:MAG: outer membrane beta-barrel protein [Sphingobium sp.]
MKHATTKASALALMVLPLASPAWAQGRSVDLRVGIRTIYDSNVTRSASSVTGNLQRSNWRLLPNITANMSIPFGRHSFSLTGLVGYDINLNNNGLNRERISLIPSMNFSTPRCNATVSGNFSRNQSDYGAYDRVTGNFASGSVKNVETLASVNASGGCGATVGFRPVVGAGYSRASNSNIVRQRNDRDSVNYMGGIAYTHPLVGNAQIFVSRSETRFDNRPLPTGGQSGYNSTSYGASFSRNIGSKLTASAQASYTKVDSRSTQVGGSSGLNWSVDLSANVIPRMQVSTQLSRRFSSSLAVDSVYNRETTYGVAANYALTPRTQVQGSYTYRTRKFYGFQAVTGAPSINSDQSQQASIGVTHTLNRRMSLNLRGGRSKRTAKGGFYDYTSYVGEAGLDFKF